MVNAWEKFSDITLQNVAMMLGQSLASIEGSMSTFTHSAGEAAVNKTVLEKRLDQITKRMVDHPITKRRSADAATFRIMDQKMMVGPWAITPILQSALQDEEMIFQTVFETSNIGMTALAT